MDVAQEREPQARRLAEGLVTEGAIAADRDERGAPSLQRACDLSQAGELGRSDATPVVAVERHDDVRLARVLLQRDQTAESGGQRETGRGSTPSERDHAASLPLSGIESNPCLRPVLC